MGGRNPASGVWSNRLEHMSRCHTGSGECYRSDGTVHAGGAVEEHRAFDPT